MKRVTMNRRTILIGAMTAAAGLAAPARANEQRSFVLPQEFVRTVVTLDADFAPGELHVLPDQFRLYWILTRREAIRFTVGVGRPGLYHAGRFTVGDKREWPSWRPTPEMIARDPGKYGKYADGMPGGLENPLGARALYLYDGNGRDTYLRIHGTNDPRTIGTAVSNGCARLTNEDIIFLYGGVEIGTPVLLHPQNGTTVAHGVEPEALAPVDEVGPVPREVAPEMPLMPVSLRSQKAD